MISQPHNLRQTRRPPIPPATPADQAGRRSAPRPPSPPPEDPLCPGPVPVRPNAPYPPHPVHPRPYDPRHPAKLQGQSADPAFCASGASIIRHRPGPDSLTGLTGSAGFDQADREYQTPIMMWCSRMAKSPPATRPRLRNSARPRPPLPRSSPTLRPARSNGAPRGNAAPEAPLKATLRATPHGPPDLIEILISLRPRSY